MAAASHAEDPGGKHLQISSCLIPLTKACELGIVIPYFID